jgi:hypothetical protein
MDYFSRRSRLKKTRDILSIYTYQSTDAIRKRHLLLHMQCYIYTKCMYIWYHFIHNICWNVKNILYSNFMIIYRLCKALSFTWSMTLSSTIWFWILKTFSQQLNDKLPTWKYISTFRLAKTSNYRRFVSSCQILFSL